MGPIGPVGIVSDADHRARAAAVIMVLDADQAAATTKADWPGSAVAGRLRAVGGRDPQVRRTSTVCACRRPPRGARCAHCRPPGTVPAS